MVEEFYTIEQVAELSNKSQKTVRRHIAANKLVASKSQNKYRILKSEYERWINSDDSNEELNRETFAAGKSTDREYCWQRPEPAHSAQGDPGTDRRGTEL